MKIQFQFNWREMWSKLVEIYWKFIPEYGVAKKKKQNWKSVFPCLFIKKMGWTYSNLELSKWWLWLMEPKVVLLKPIIMSHC
jgi:hypothetical protein